MSLGFAAKRTKKKMPDSISTAFAEVDINRDYERFCSKRMDRCILWMWIFCSLQALFTADVVFSSESTARHILWIASNVGWATTIILWIRYFIGSWRAHCRAVNSMDSSIEAVEKLVAKMTPAPPLPPQLASSSTSSSVQQGNAANGQI